MVRVDGIAAPDPPWELVFLHLFFGHVIHFTRSGVVAHGQIQFGAVGLVWQAVQVIPNRLDAQTDFAVFFLDLGVEVRRADFHVIVKRHWRGAFRLL